MGRYTRWFRWVNVGVILMTFLAYLAPRVSPAVFWPLAFFGLLYPWLLLTNVLFVVGWLVARKRYWFFSLGCILLGWGHFTSLVGLGGTTPGEDPAAPVLTVMTFNCHSFRATDRRGALLSVEALSEWMEDQACDILCLQEFNRDHDNADAFRRLFASKLGLKHAFLGDQGELAIFSRFPLHNRETHYFENNANGYQVTDVAVGGEQRVRLYNVHLQSNSISTLADKVASQGNLQEKETWIDIRGMLGRFRRANRLRAAQAVTLTEQLAGSPHPVILAGDLNDIPQSYTYHTVTRRLRDAFREGAVGLGTTYTGKIPGLRIDYIFVDRPFRVLGYYRGAPNFSDHRPVFCRLEIGA